MPAAALDNPRSAIKSKIDAYTAGVIGGTIPASKLIRRSVDRHVYDLRTCGERGLRFDEDEGSRAVQFFGFLRHSKGEWAGQPFVLEPWQCFLIWCLFGWKISGGERDGYRRFRTAYNELPRKNGKSTLAAGVGLYLFFADGEGGAEVYTAATKRDQAIIVHSEAVRMVNASPPLKQRIGVLKNNLHITGTASKFEPLGEDDNTLDGLNVHGAIIDELHAHKGRGLWDVLDTATGSRRQPMMFTITTAGHDLTSLCGELHEYAIQILEGFDKPDGIHDDNFFAFVACADEGDDWLDPKTWRKANPNYGLSVKPDDLAAKAQKAAQIPSALNAFLRLHLNRWTQQDIAWLDVSRWDACRREIDFEELKGQCCWAGMDLASKLDLTALVLLFRDDDGTYRIRPWFWIPEATAKRVEQKNHRVTYGAWIREGWIEQTPGEVTDYEYIEQRVVEISEKYSLSEVAFDPWNAQQTATRLTEHHGISVVEFRQGFASMSEPTKELERLIVAEKILHDGNPVMRWMIGNVAVRNDPAGNIKPEKPEHNSAKKIDGVVATIMALGRAMVAANNEVGISFI